MGKRPKLARLYLEAAMRRHWVRDPYWSPFGVWLCCCTRCEPPTA
jgi:hypothetical protein